MRRVLLGAVLLVGLALPVLSQTISSASFGVLKYFPGDVVHIVVEAPPDVVNITALMPDGERLNLSYSRRTRVWHNYWEVPAGFKKGGYSAKLKAEDAEGRAYEGDSELFYVGEPTLPMVMQVGLTGEARSARPPVPEKEIEKTKEIAPTLQKPKRASKPVKIVKARKPRRSGAMPKLARRPRVISEPDRLRLMVQAREYYFKHDYGKLKGKLDELIKIDPDNREIRTLRKQITK
jgi:hypothetical protein